MSRGRARVIGGTMLVLGVAAVVAAVTVMMTSLGQRGDERAMWSMAVPARTSRLLSAWLDVVSVEFIAVVLAGAVVLAVLRRRFSRAAAALVVVAGANVTTQLLKALLPRPDFGIGLAHDNSLPSGHVTVVTSLVVAALVAAPAPARRVMTCLATAAGTLTGAAVLILRWHRPSDVIAAFGVCAVYAGLGLMVADHASDRVDTARTQALPVSRPRTLGHAVAALGGCALAGVFLLTSGLVAHGQQSDTLVGGVVLVAVALTCAAVMLLTALGLDRTSGQVRPLAPPARTEQLAPTLG